MIKKAQLMNLWQRYICQYGSGKIKENLKKAGEVNEKAADLADGSHGLDDHDFDTDPGACGRWF